MSKPHKRLVQAFGIILCLASLAASQIDVQTSGALLFKLECPDRVKGVAFSPDGARLAFAAEEIALLYDLRSGKTVTLGTRVKMNDAFISVSFAPDGRSVFVFTSPDGRHLIAGGGSVYGEKSVEIWDAGDGKRVGRLDGFRSGLFGLAISNSGRLFAVAGGDYGGGGDLSLWELNGAREVGYVDHYRTRFIELASGGARELRSDADSIEVLLKGGPSKKREAFSRIFEREEQFLTSLLRASFHNAGRFSVRIFLPSSSTSSKRTVASMPCRLKLLTMVSPISVKWSLTSATILGPEPLKARPMRPGCCGIARASASPGTKDWRCA